MSNFTRDVHILVHEEEQLLTNFVNVSPEPKGACEPNLEAEDKED
jgi:hypothetical protein